MIEARDERAQAKKTLYTLILGILVSGAFLGASGALLLRDIWWQFLLGVVLGTAVACGLAVHLYKSIDVALDMEPDFAKRFMRGRSTMRMGLMGITLVAALLLPEYLHVLGVFLGLMGLKTGAYLQPGILKLIEKRKEGE